MVGWIRFFALSGLYATGRASLLSLGFIMTAACSTAPPVAEPTSVAGYAPDTISLTTWNIGYGGLGRESDFVKDGGNRLLPPSRAAVEKNVAGIRSVLTGIESDMVLLQEVGSRSLMTRYVPVERTLRNVLGDGFYWFSPDIGISLLPPPVGVAFGPAITTDLPVAERRLEPLTREPAALFGLLDRRYAAMVVELPRSDGPPWTIINVHLAAFDEEGRVRQEQMRDVLRIALAEYAKGHPVIIGGDWNIEIGFQTTPRPTQEDYPFWLARLDPTAVPQGWQVAFDSSQPTVRTVAQAYQPGMNYTAIIDGFIVSPNVEAVSVETTDTNFEMSDHMPVTARFRLR